MKIKDKSWKKNGYVLRLSRKDDAEAYYERNFNPLQNETARLTGSKTQYTHDEVVCFFQNCIDAVDRYDFVIVASNGQIIGESVLNEIDTEAKSANFRIVIFHSDDFNKGLGSWAIKHTLAFAFEDLRLHRVELDVFAFNQRAKRAYEKAGFKQEGVRRDAIYDRGSYADDIIMAILEDEWIAQNK